VTGKLDNKSTSYAEKNESKGLISVFARHPTASNLLIVIMLLAGLVGAWRMNTQFFPNFGLDIIVVNVKWNGASAQDVDLSIVQSIESETRFLDEVKRVGSTAREGSASIVVEFNQGADMQAALSNVEAAVSQVTSLPKDSEAPKITRVVRYDTIARLGLSGPYSEDSLRQFAKRMRNEMMNLGIDRVTFSGLRDPEIWVEVDPNKLRSLDLSLSQVAQSISKVSQDIPSGETGSGSKQIRSLGLEDSAYGISKISVKNNDGGGKLYISDISIVHETFDNEQVTVSSSGLPAIELKVQRATTADSLKTAKILDKYLENVSSSFPSDLSVVKYGVESNLVKERIWLLIKNGLGGLVLVTLILFIFLNTKVAFWVGLGIPAALMAALAVMALTGQSINMISLFALILVLGIVVDDAIVIGEHAEYLHRKGHSALEAAEKSALRMSAPVFSSTLTTIATFIPLFLIGDVIGAIIIAIPLAVCAALSASLFECFLALPGHMKSALSSTKEKTTGLRARFNQTFNKFRDGPFRKCILLAVKLRYLTISLSICALILSVGLVTGGRVGFTFFPSVEPDIVYANFRLVPGSGRTSTESAVNKIELAAYAVERELGFLPNSLIVKTVAKVGRTSGSFQSAQNYGDEVGSVFLELIPADIRDVRTQDFLKKWRENLPDIAGLDIISLNPAQGGPPGRELDVRVSGGQPETLKRVGVQIRNLLESYPGVDSVDDDLPYGKSEIVMKVTEKGKALGYTTESVATQVRHAYSGVIAKRFARDDDEVLIRVRLNKKMLSIKSLGELNLSSPKGINTPLSEVVNFIEKTGFALVRRENGMRQVAITAEIDEMLTSGSQVIRNLERDGIYSISESNGLKVHFSGKAEEQQETFADMQVGAIVGLTLMYLILSWVFSSFLRPFAVMAIIPFSLIGAIMGHWIMGFDLTILSMISLLGLSGIAVNDSIVLITTIDGRIKSGEETQSAVCEGTLDRLRAVLLTSLTTIGGLAPLMLETSLQARFLIPMATTIVFGLMIVTLLVLFLVPAFVMVGDDFKNIRMNYKKAYN
jgi:multidrug efflux pump subunit AcrB|tara:strand:+ start:4922 stop:8074 length:3153 start_codon:yes stop_codon:yes gene_type:complete